jgi:hypothetical protein
LDSVPNQFVAVNCSTDAIVPAWASILVTIQLPFATKIVDGNIDDLNAALYEELLAKIDFSAYVNKSIIIKGCSQSRFLHRLCIGRNIYNPIVALCTALAQPFRYTKQKNRMN